MPCQLIELDSVAAWEIECAEGKNKRSETWKHVNHQQGITIFKYTVFLSTLS